ncbi:hypothetical protein [Photorhabdus sp. CRCIA-P01]|uniref:hypothetical protein n=1 Tax=Photorhabdus sp. CRCIA-P01 TaxID=2019570 RepID=UPI0018E52DDA|nr:hypothetical protein [Photorhabdus sp. CRCIA-P01]
MTHNIEIICFFIGVTPSSLKCGLAGKPQNYLYTSSDELEQLGPLLERQDIAGVQIVYSWK